MAGIKTKDFSLLNIKDTFDESSESLLGAIQKYNPNVDLDAFDMELRQLVMRYGRGGYTTSLAESTASLEETKPVFIEAGDVLVLAHEAWKNGHKKEALKLFVTAQDCDGMNDLMDAIHLNNSKSAIGTVASSNSDDDSEEDNSDEESNESAEEENAEGEDDTDIFPIADDEEDNEDKDDDETDDDMDSTIANLASISGDADAIVEKATKLVKDPDEADDDDNSSSENDERVPMGNVSSKRVEASLRLAAANKLSLTGTKQDREKARRVMRA
jgi:hypothetical protein